MATTDDETAELLNQLKRASGVNDEWLARWDYEAWRQWGRAMTADPDGPCPGAPDWMQSFKPHWHDVDFFCPLPCVGRVAYSEANWPALAVEHDDLTLSAELMGDTAPDVNAVSRAWAVARRNGGRPALTVSLLPAAPWGRAVTGAIEALYVTDVDEDQAGLITAILDRRPAAPLLVPPDGWATGPVHAWEWFIT